MRPYRHIPFIATAIAALVCPLARAEELPASGPLPLGDVVAYARAHNPEQEAARQRQAAARAVPAQAAAWDDPTLAAESWNTPRAVPYDGADNNILKLSQRLPFPGKLGLKGRMAARDADMAAADARMTELTVLESVKQAYWDLWLTDRHLAVYTRDLELARELAAGAAGRYAVGTGGQPDVLRAEVERTHVATRLVTTRLERERAAARLNELLSRGPEEPLGRPSIPGRRTCPGRSAACSRSRASTTRSWRCAARPSRASRTTSPSRAAATSPTSTSPSSASTTASAATGTAP